MVTMQIATHQLLDGETVSTWIGIPAGTLAQWRYLGKGPAYVKVGRHVRYRAEDVDAWLASQTRGGDAA
jgi:predicted DNA-binding transcriptional regulator AlpA